MPCPVEQWLNLALTYPGVRWLKLTVGAYINVVCESFGIVRKLVIRSGLLFSAVLVILVLLDYQTAYAQTQPTNTDFWSSLDASVKVIAGVVAAITAILGIPVAFLQIRKTIVEIRKIELEAQKLQEQTGAELPKEFQGHQIYLNNSDGNNIQILVDPRFSAPLLILLDF